jgi:hypothetical protein
MSIEAYLVIVIVTLAALYFVVPMVIGTYIRYRGTRVIICPETKKPAAVEVDVRHAAVTAATSRPDLRLRSCSRWPERQDCGQECLLQIELSPEDCLAHAMLVHWYKGKRCAFCDKLFAEIHWSARKPALLNREGKTIEWQEIRPENIPAVLATHKPVCWDCHNLQVLIREHPGLVYERPSHEVHIASK